MTSRILLKVQVCMKIATFKTDYKRGQSMFSYCYNIVMWPSQTFTCSSITSFIGVLHFEYNCYALYMHVVNIVAQVTVHRGAG